MRALRVAFALVAPAFGACVLVHDLGSTDGGALPDAGDDREAKADTQATDAATTDADADASSSNDGPTGPGPLGALPSGYCCTSDAECRFRHCVDTGGGNRMCLDECSASRPKLCMRPGFAFTCVSNMCEPQGAFACLDPSTFARGTATTGACCKDVEDGTTGQECEANLCIATGSNPWVCTRICDGGADCPADYRCYPVGNRMECVPRVSPYTCK